MRDGDAGANLPVRAAGEVGQLARSFDELSQSLRRSSQELEEQNRSLNESVRRLQGLLRVEQELNATLDVDPLIRRVAMTLCSALGYERAGIVLVEGENLTYYFGDAAKGNSFAPPIRASPGSCWIKTSARSWCGQRPLRFTY